MKSGFSALPAQFWRVFPHPRCQAVGCGSGAMEQHSMNQRGGISVPAAMLAARQEQHISSSRMERHNKTIDRT